MFYIDIKDKRLRKHLTQKQLAKRVHISQPYISMIENNVKVAGVRIGLVDDLAKALDCTGHDILKWKEKEQG